MSALTLSTTPRKHNRLGEAGERAARRAFRKAGYRVRRTVKGREPGDLRLVSADGEVFYIEVKTARVGSRQKKWRFTLFKYGCTTHAGTDLVLLLPLVEDGRLVPFLVPTVELKAQRQAVISSHPDRYAGRLAEWRQSSLPPGICEKLLGAEAPESET